MGRLVPNSGEGGGVGDCWRFWLKWFFPLLFVLDCHPKGFGTLFLPDKGNTPARNFQIGQKYWAGPPKSKLQRVVKHASKCREADLP